MKLPIVVSSASRDTVRVRNKVSICKIAVNGACVYHACLGPYVGGAGDRYM